MSGFAHIFLFVNVIKIATSDFPNSIELSLANFVLWPNATVPFYINSEHFDQEQSLTILTGLALFAFKTCLKFAPMLVPPEGNQHAMVFENPKGVRQCVLDARGHSVDEPHIISLGYECLLSPQLEMMIMRGLGFGFEHNRMSRDLFIDVQQENIEIGYLELFTKDVLALPIELRNLPYDLNSVMHFGERDFSKNGHRTIIIKDHNVKQDRVGLTDTDLRKIELVYGPECRRRDRLEKIELCQSYPGVARRKREAYRRKSLRINPDITPPELATETTTVNEPSTETPSADVSENLTINLDTTTSPDQKETVSDAANLSFRAEELSVNLKELGIENELQEIVDKIHMLSAKALASTRSKYCNLTKGSLRSNNDHSSDVLGIVGKISDLTKSMVDHALSNLTEFCEDVSSIGNYARQRCNYNVRDPSCPEPYKPTRYGLVRHSTQHWPAMHYPTRPKNLGDKAHIYEYVPRRNNNDTVEVTTAISKRRKRDVASTIAYLIESVKAENTTDSVTKTTNRHNGTENNTLSTTVGVNVTIEDVRNTNLNISISENATLTLPTTETVVINKLVNESDKKINTSKQHENANKENNIGNFNQTNTHTNAQGENAKVEKLIDNSTQSNSNVTVSVNNVRLNGTRRKLERAFLTGVIDEPLHSESGRSEISLEMSDEKKEDEESKEEEEKSTTTPTTTKRSKVTNRQTSVKPKTANVQYSAEEPVSKKTDNINTKKKARGPIRTRIEYNDEDSVDNKDDIIEPPLELNKKKLNVDKKLKDVKDSKEYQHKNYNEKKKVNKAERTIKKPEDNIKEVTKKKVTEENSFIGKKTKQIGFVPKTVKLSKENEAFYKDRQWPDGIVRYLITDEKKYDIDDLRLRLEAVNAILKRKTCVRLIEIYPDEAEKYNDYLVLDTSPDYVTGRVGGKQIFGSVELFLGGQHKQHTAMMVMAMLGFYFEVSRHDRDKYIRVHVRHIRPDKLHHFEKIREDATLNLPYDFKSATHPAWQFWRKLGKTGISTVATFKNKDPNGQIMKKLGQNDQLLSDLDIVKINSIYSTKCLGNPKTFKRMFKRRRNRRTSNYMKKRKINSTLIIF